ncbi:hypothetical protein DEI99_017055 [Curtobacterium sp. MCLR17_036]|uniref:hypothetical protein n=1 Tax=Curtobacterium sp. MCLR17_036 TaxID=2175620 RepID=UPI000DA9FF3A|nr:hypothetical protein [Curtobacterium sp. MCLR17_036]WIE64920.1 hypothetical protein DEI99_017055 [Curtobacterium sp. MCLR17_036]
MNWSFVEPQSHLLLTMAVVLFLGALAFVIPTIVAVRRRTATDALAWADQVRRDPAAPWAVDRVLRSVDASCANAGVVFPGAVRMTVGTTVRLDLASPTIAPPQPWTATPDGRSWTAPMWALQAVPLVAAAPTEFATVVSLGTDGDETVLVDLRRVRGVVALRGERPARAALLQRIVDQVRTDPWATGTAVLSVGGASDAGTAVSVRDAIAAVTADATPGLLVVARVPAGADGRELVRLLERPGGRWACVAAEPHTLARWTLEVRRDGTHVSDVLGTVQWTGLGLSVPLAASVTADTVTERDGAEADA